jgi:hypothetical protein
MSQQQFDQFMEEQVAAIESSGLTFEEWIEQRAEAFRAEWENSHVE